MGELRIIAGEYGSRRISVPLSVTRPTTDRIREALFSSLESLRGGMDGARVLDAFAGSGALAFEALSRGAQGACLVERDAKSAGMVRRNASVLGCADLVDVLCCDALTNASRIAAAGPFDVVFLDPPYAVAPGAVAAFLDDVGSAGGFGQEVLIAYEHDAANGAVTEAAFADGPFRFVRQKRYGKSQIGILATDRS